MSDWPNYGVENAKPVRRGVSKDGASLPFPSNHTHTPVGSTKCWQNLRSRGQCVAAWGKGREQDKTRHQLSMATYHPPPSLQLEGSIAALLTKRNLNWRAWNEFAHLCAQAYNFFPHSVWVAILLNTWNKHQSSQPLPTLSLMVPLHGEEVTGCHLFLTSGRVHVLGWLGTEPI